METTLHAPDIECDGCANSIKRALGRIEGVHSVDVDVPAKNVSINYEAPADSNAIVTALDRAGFPVASTD